MPVIAQELIQVHANDDLTVTILDEINRCGCINSATLSNDLNIPLLTLKNKLRRIAEIKCDKDYDICCTDEDALKSFVTKLKGLK